MNQPVKAIGFPAPCAKKRILVPVFRRNHWGKGLIEPLGWHRPNVIWEIAMEIAIPKSDNLSP